MAGMSLREAGGALANSFQIRPSPFESSDGPSRASTPAAGSKLRVPLAPGRRACVWPCAAARTPSALEFQAKPKLHGTRDVLPG